MSERPYLHALAERCGVEGWYRGYDGGERWVSASTREALLAALGFDASTEAQAERALQALDAEATRPGLQPVRVVRAGSPDLGRVELRMPSGARGKLRLRLELEFEDGAKHALQSELDVERDVLSVPIPRVTELSFGYHTLRCTFELDGRSFSSAQDLIVAPTSCLQLFELIGERRAVGVWTHLYTLHSRRSWGIGDLTDLRALLDWAADHRLELVGINPLHAADNLASEVSPYYPLSRLYRNPIYLDVEAVATRSGSDEAHALLRSADLQAVRAELQKLPRVDYARVHAAKRRVLDVAHAVFAARHHRHGTELGRAYAAYRSREGQPLRDFSTFCALREHLMADDARYADWRAWPALYRDARSDAVTVFAEEHADAVDLHAYLQLQLEEQLGACRRTASGSGMAVGLYGDLALGDAPFSADVWAQPGLYARDVSIGAPPDAYSDDGQGWGLVPFDPIALRAQRYRAFGLLVRQAFRHMGALRIDHVMGIARQFWVPSGQDPRHGGYVRFPLSDLLGILALESRRARALVIGEDLGVVPDGFREQMEQNGLLRSQVLYFEREHDGSLRGPRNYARAALATVSTHDLPPLAGFWTGSDLRVRRRAGNIASDEALERALAEREHAKTSLLALLRREGLLSDEPTEPTLETLVEALQLLLAGANSRLIGVALDDLTLESDALNTPATSLQQEPNWSRRSRLSLEEIASDERIRDVVRGVGQRAQRE